jgi:iron-sulfur cluster repair protein YtfE (RIC family)
MEMQRHVCRALHDDHAATIALLDRLETLLGRHGERRAPDAADAALTGLLKDLIFIVQTEIGTHFTFEEELIFPVLAEAGDRDMVELLVDEHAAILPLARRLVELAKQGRAGGFAAEAWREFHQIGAELVERLVSHIQKEEMGLLPALDDLLDESADGRLALELASRR